MAVEELNKCGWMIDKLKLADILGDNYHENFSKNKLTQMLLDVSFIMLKNRKFYFLNNRYNKLC